MATTKLTPTDEQQAILDAFRTGTTMVVEAGAGTGKTSTLRLLAEDRPAARMSYVAFNKSVADEAARSFPRNVDCRTAHSIAFATHGRALMHKADRKKMLPHEAMRHVNPPRDAVITTGVGDVPVSALNLSKYAQATADRFAKGADEEIGPQHVPYVRGLTTEREMTQLHDLVVPLARKVWADRMNPNGMLEFRQQDYLKAWGLSRPRIDTDVILYDEAQDADPIVLDVIHRQDHAQIVAVGDSAQAIYQWRGAVDSMGEFDGPHLPLTQSFRFGPAVADEANVWLELLGSQMRIRGTESLESVIGAIRGPNAILCRTNGGVIGQLIDIQAKGISTSVGGKNAAAKIKGDTRAIETLMRRGKTNHPSFWLYESYDHLISEILAAEARDEVHEHALIVRLVEKYGPEPITAAIDRCVPNDRARVTVSTVHVAKGLEWDAVRIGDDFRSPGMVEDQYGKQVRADLDPTEACGAYVAVTRAKWYLDPTGVEWGRELLDEKRATRPTAQRGKRSAA